MHLSVGCRVGVASAKQTQRKASVICVMAAATGASRHSVCSCSKSLVGGSFLLWEEPEDAKASSYLLSQASWAGCADPGTGMEEADRAVPLFRAGCFRCRVCDS